jgi:hypothetical protein
MTPASPSKAHALSRRRLASLLGTSEEAVARITNVRLHQGGWVSFHAPDPMILSSLHDSQHAE